jgi:hypothetical protein
MASLDRLPADQRAVLQLVLQRGQTYDDIAQLLSIDRAAVRDRALSAFDALGPQTRVPPERRALITDYLLGQLPPRVSEEVRNRLAESASERAWARVLASELAPIASEPLPEIPVEAAPRQESEFGAAPESGAAPTREPAFEAVSEEPAIAAAAAAPTDETPALRPEQRPPSQPPRSRLGGAVLLAGGALIVVVVVIVVVLISGSNSSTSHRATSTAAASTSTTSAATSTNSAHVVAHINLVSPTHGKAAGIAEVLKQGNNSGIAIVAQGLVPNSKHPPNAYAVWLYNSPADSRILGFVNPAVGANGRLSAASGLPASAGHYKQLLVTLETQATPHAPGMVILEGQLTGL